MLEKIALLERQVPITVVMANARSQRCRLVIKRAADLGIEVLFLPTYSPNLNLIERLWKFVRKECLYAKYYENFELFKHALQHCLSETIGRHKSALSRLLTLEFQTFLSTTSDL
ncbi:MAG: IS630 family transposase [Ktedonobacteraceae bacterium]